MFDHLIGNKEVKTILRRLVADGRVPRSLLFSGEDGVGKREFAIEVARSLVCREPKAGEPCRECPSCRRAGAFAFPKPDDKDEHKKLISSEHPDVGMVIPYGRNILVDAVRDLEKEANFLPFEAKARVFIVDDAEKMNDAASNALLKTLEEPPLTAHIFLITSRPDSLLATIRSRCQMLRFSPIPADEITDYLIQKENVSIEDATLAARLARGSVSRAISIDTGKFRTQRDVVLGVLRAILQDDDRRALLRIGEKLNDAANKDGFEENLDILQTLIRDAWCLRMGENEGKLVNVDLAGDLAELGKKAEPSRFTNWQQEIETMREGLIVNINRKIATDALFMEMAA